MSPLFGLYSGAGNETMINKIEKIKHNIQEIKDMVNLIEGECKEILNTAGNNELKTLSNTEIINIFGEFKYKEMGGGRILITDNWRNENIIILDINGVKIWCNKFIASQFSGAFAEVMSIGLWADIDLSNGGGCYVARHKNWNIKSTLSKHSWGIALDINPKKYPIGSQERINQKVIDIFNKYGFYYGGDWRRPDPMHIEWARYIL